MISRDAFGNDLDDLNIAIRGLSEKQKQKVFANGKKFVNLEILYPASVYHSTLWFEDVGSTWFDRI